VTTGKLSLHSVPGSRFLPWQRGVSAQPAAVIAEHWQSLAAETRQGFHHAAETGSDQQQPVMPGPDDVSSCQYSEEQFHTPTDPEHFVCRHTTTSQAASIKHTSTILHTYSKCIQSEQSPDVSLFQAAFNTH